MATFPTLTSPPTPSPNRNTQTSSEFSDAVDNRLSWDTSRTSDLNSWSSAANTTATEAQTSANDASNSATQAASSASSASTYADQAAASSNFKGQWGNLTGSLSIPSTVEHEGITYELLNNLADVTASEPPNSDWLVRDGTIPNGAVGNIQDPLYHLPLKNSLSPVVGIGSVTFNRSGTATHTNRYDEIVNLADAVPGFDADGLDLPCASTNLFRYSSSSHHGGYTASRTTIDASDIQAPNGEIEGTKLTETAENGIHYMYQGVAMEAGKQYTLYAIAKKAERSRLMLYDFGTGSKTALFDLEAGTASNQTFTDVGIVPLKDGWFLCWATFSILTTESRNYGFGPALDDGNNIYSGEVGKGLYIWHTQIEALPFWTPPIYTTSAPATRNGATLQFPYAENFPGSLKDKTVLMDVEVKGIKTSYPRIFDSGDLILVVTNNNLDILRPYSFMAVNHATVSDSVADTPFRFGTTYSANLGTLKTYVSGIQISEASATESATPLDSILIGDDRGYYKIKNLRIFDKAFNNPTMRIA